jgi:PhnB protein
MRLNPYLTFDGNCAEAFAFYERCFDSKVAMTMLWSDMPDGREAPPGMADKIMHTRLDVSGVALMGSDAPPDRYSRPAGITVSLSLDAPDQAERVFAALGEGGQVTMPMQETFWAHRFGTMTDRFGIPWMIYCEKQMGAAQ